MPGETRALLSALCHVPWAIFNPAVTTTAKPNTAAYWAAAEVGGVCVRVCVGVCVVKMHLPKDESRKEMDSVVDNKHQKLFW